METTNRSVEGDDDQTYSSDEEVDPSASVKQPLASTTIPSTATMTTTAVSGGHVDSHSPARRLSQRRLWYSFGGKVFCVVGSFEYVSDVIIAIHQQLGPRLSHSPLDIELTCDERVLVADDVSSAIPVACGVAPGNQRLGTSSRKSMLVAHIPSLGGTAPASSMSRRSSPPGRATSASKSRNHTPSRGASSRSEAEKRCRDASTSLSQALADVASVITAASTSGKPPLNGDAAIVALKALISKEVAEALHPVNRQIAAFASAHKGLTEALEQLLKQPVDTKPRSSSKDKK